MPRRVADGQVRHMVAEDVEFRRGEDLPEIDNGRIVGAHEGTERGVAPEEGENVL